MTRKQKIEYLESYREADQRVRALEWQIEKHQEQIVRCRESMMNPSLAIDGMPHGSPDDPMAKYAIRIEKLERKVLDDIALRQKRIVQCQALQSEIEANLNRMSNRRYSDLLWLYYIDNCTWAQVAERLDCAERHVYRIYERAIQQFDRKVRTCH